MAFRGVTGVSDIFLDLTEAVIRNRYTAHYDDSGSASFVCNLSRRGSFQNMMDADFLVRKNRCISANDVETARFYINMGIHFRSLCSVVDRLCSDIQTENETSSTSESKKHDAKIDFVDTADLLTKTIGGLSYKPKAGAALDLTGRMTFRFQSAVNPAEIRNLVGSVGTEVGIDPFGSIVHLTLVLDPTELFIVKPLVQKIEGNRGTILLGISLRNIIAAAVDQTWLHIAIRSSESIISPTLIKNGNMALRFESAGTCLIVKQYLDRSREVLRQDLLTKIPELLQ